MRRRSDTSHAATAVAGCAIECAMQRLAQPDRRGRGDGMPPDSRIVAETCCSREASAAATSPEGESFSSRGIRQKLFTLPDDTRVYPGHGDITTTGEERRSNPFCRRRAGLFGLA